MSPQRGARMSAAPHASYRSYRTQHVLRLDNVGTLPFPYRTPRQTVHFRDSPDLGGRGVRGPSKGCGRRHLLRDTAFPMRCWAGWDTIPELFASSENLPYSPLTYCPPVFLSSRPPALVPTTISAANSVPSSICPVLGIIMAPTQQGSTVPDQAEDDATMGPRHEKSTRLPGDNLGSGPKSRQDAEAVASDFVVAASRHDPSIVGYELVSTRHFIDKAGSDILRRHAQGKATIKEIESAEEAAAAEIDAAREAGRRDLAVSSPLTLLLFPLTSKTSDSAAGRVEVEDEACIRQFGCHQRCH